jgi:phenylalanyl-tRNA synthetase alpha chain
MTQQATERIAEIEREATAAIATAATTPGLEDVRIRYLGRKAELPNLLRGVAQLPPEERAATGKAANQIRQKLESELERKAGELAASELDERLKQDRIDVTLPPDPLPAIGRLHLMTRTRREIEDVFVGLGFNVAEGPEVETVYYNFDALNHASTHPSRLETDTFYVDDGSDPVDIFDPTTRLLRVHTSPAQIHAMESQPPPIYIIVPGRVYRPDSDATHTPQFHQIEGLAVDEDVTLADLKGTLLTFARAIFGPEREVRLRPHFFPFTEPSVEVDVSCFNCTQGITGTPRGSASEPVVSQRCPLCKGTAWIEILGSGMVDPNVFSHVADHGYDPEKVQGFAFGLGIERIAMLKHGVPDLRLFYDNDVRFLEQF